MKKINFALRRRNQKGQVAIFVALIFQVVFVFFAVLINVGLLVHHKINLQQSTDLAAYYGAMKQAETMNMISHVNFQMRQAWKLLTWRYRVAGTFGFQKTGRNPATEITFPLNISFNGSTPNTYDSASGSFRCSDSGVGILDTPFFCMGHIGMADWNSPNENNCRVDCGHISNFPNQIAPISPISGGDSTYGSGSTGGAIQAVNNALNQANVNIANLCKRLGPLSFSVLSRYIMAYGNEVQNKKRLIQMLGANLSAGADTAVDLEGGLIKTGATKTFENNLTEANLSGKISFAVVNGLADNECSFKGAAEDGDGNSAQFLTEIKIPMLQFFIHNCIGETGTTKNYLPASIYGNADHSTLNPVFLVKGTGGASADNSTTPMSGSEIDSLNRGILGTKFIVGYEKNPWCQVYYGAKAQSEPKIPFLPIAKIRLSAVAFAKPFGGTIGPRYMNVWSNGQKKSDAGAKVDSTLPPREIGTGITTLTALKQSETVIPNYANYVGDSSGLRDSLVVATYQDMLLHRQPRTEISTLNISKGKSTAGAAPTNVGMTKANVWPSTNNWRNLSEPGNVSSYDYLASDASGSGNSYLRDIEVSVVAPNQFDLAYYSIDPDFYNNYYLKLVGGDAGPVKYTESLSKIRSAAGGNGPGDIAEIRPDYGYNRVLSDSNFIAKGFSVRHQLAVAAKIIKVTNPMSQSLAPFAQNLNFIPDKPSSLLTGWTFQDFSSYETFPSAGPNGQNTMTFGKCMDTNWNMTDNSDEQKNYDSPVTSNFPPTPGNCVSGGRTGYSVKLVPPILVRAQSPAEPLGGDGTSGRLSNPVKESFFNF